MTQGMAQTLKVSEKKRSETHLPKKNKLSKQEFYDQLGQCITRESRRIFKNNNKVGVNMNLNFLDLRLSDDFKETLVSIGKKFSYHVQKIKKALLGTAATLLFASGLYTVALGFNPTSAAACVEEYTYTVVSGDNLTQIAKRHGVGVENIKYVNELNNNNLKVGQKLILPAHNQITGEHVHETTTKVVISKQDKSEINANVKAYINASNLLVRAQPDRKGAVIGSFKRNTEILLINTNNGWAKIKYQGKIGYVSSAFLNFGAPASNKQSATKTTTTSTKETVVGKTMFVKASKLNVRSQPNTSSSVLGSVSNGKKLTVVSKLNNGWSKVVFNGKNAFVNSSYLVEKTVTTTSTSTKRVEVTATIVQTMPTSNLFKVRVNGSLLNVGVTNKAWLSELNNYKGDNLKLTLDYTKGKNPVLVTYH